MLPDGLALGPRTIPEEFGVPEFASAPSAPVPLLQFNGLVRTIGRQFAVATVRIISDRPAVGCREAISKSDFDVGADGVDVAGVSLPVTSGARPSAVRARHWSSAGPRQSKDRPYCAPACGQDQSRGCSGRHGSAPRPPHVPQRPGAGGGLRAVGELAVEASANRPAVEEPQFPASRE
jgi:hypothetical protein